MRVLSGLALDRATHKKSQPGRCEIASGTRAPLGHQNQPPDGTRPLMRRYVTRLP